MRVRAGLGAFVMVGSILTGLLQPHASAQVAAVAAPAPFVHVWQININHLQKNWHAFIERMALADYDPDIILVQELCYCGTTPGGAYDLDRFMTALNNAFPSHYAFAHGADPGEGVAKSAFAVIWRTSRFSQQGVRRWPVMVGDSCNQSQKLNVAVDLFDNAVLKHVVAASVHYPPGMTGSCIRTNLGRADTEIELLQPTKPLSIVAGDMNQRPDEHGALPTNGAETDPDCWYRNWSSPHANSSVLSDNCGGYVYDKYVDAVWAYPGFGGHLNPVLPLFCNQYTFRNDAGLPPDVNDVMNSCTDVDRDGSLDHGRIDYIWVGWETDTGNAVKPTNEGSLSMVAFASADLDMSLEDVDNPTMYSDHRAVEALVRYPINNTQ